ncbi:probable calcium-binding protein CML44 [Gastrolobium bilobum]|uniref:probable calcium-binding protein CML44 n=1 Tax=Gastrolobium bilobum TaxID=150636 RepID=UPI002AB2E0EB|nr:probable calcium-binding protein CML44 [Gastrolobium bilobum]
MLFSNMCPLTLNDLQRIFEKLDMNSDGFLSLEELNKLLEKTGFKFSLEELESLVGKKSLNFSEFLFFYDSMLKQNSEEEKGVDGDNDDDEIEDVESDLVKAFKVFDLDGDGFITSQELECVLKRLGMWDERSCKDCRTMIYSYDTNLDGKLDFQEFKNMMLLTTS